MRRLKFLLEKENDIVIIPCRVSFISQKAVIEQMSIIICIVHFIL